jgi:chromosome segregation ATPase
LESRKRELTLEQQMLMNQVDDLNKNTELMKRKHETRQLEFTEQRKHQSETLKQLIKVNYQLSDELNAENRNIEKQNELLENQQQELESRKDELISEQERLMTQVEELEKSLESLKSNYEARQLEYMEQRKKRSEAHGQLTKANNQSPDINRIKPNSRPGRRSIRSIKYVNIDVLICISQIFFGELFERII